MTDATSILNGYISEAYSYALAGINEPPRGYVHAAVANGAADVIPALVARGADVNELYGSETPLASACRTCDISAIQMLISQRAALDAEPDSLTADTAPIFAAMKQLDVQPLRLLIRAGVNVNVHNESEAETPLHIAAAKADDYKCKMLLDAGANVNARDAHQRTPLMFALSTRARATSLVLVTGGADVHASDEKGRTVLERALVHSVDLDVLKLILAYGADVYANAWGNAELCCMSDNEYGAIVLAAVGVDAADQYCENLRERALWNLHDCIKRRQCHAMRQSGPEYIPGLIDMRNQLENRHKVYCIEFYERANLIRREIGNLRFAVIRQRAATLCMALFMLRFPALVVVHILEHSFLYADCIRMSCLWDLACAVKHFHDKKK